MKRPLAVILTLLIAGWTFLSAAGDDSGSTPFDTEQLLYQEVGEGQEMTVSGTVASCSVISSGVRLFIDSVSVLSENHSTISFLPEQKITVMTSDTSIMPGDVLVLRGTFAPFLQAGNPGQFDFRNWYFRQNTVCTMKDVRILQRQEGEGRLQEQLYRFRRMIWSSYEQILPEKAAATIAAISMGEKGLMEAEWKTQYQEGGIAHIIAVSGLHITMIGMSIYRFLRWIYLPISVSAVLSGGVTILYGLLTGSGISAMRAVIMFLIWLGAQICGRKYDQITGIAIAAAVLILPDVQVLQESSFWLSFLAVLTLASLVPFMQKSCGIRTGAGEALCSSIGIWIGMLPVTLYFFYQAVPWSMLVNLVVIPLMSSVMGAGIISAVAGLYSKSLGVFLGAPEIGKTHV